MNLRRHQSAAAAKRQSRKDHQRAGASFARSSPAATEPPGDPLEPILDAPDFPQPMYEALRDLSQDFLFPGLEHVPPNTVTLAGDQSEIRRIVPGRTECRNEPRTALAQLPDRSARYLSSASSGIHRPATSNLTSKRSTSGATASLARMRSAGDNLVLLIRGELLRRYPNSVIYAVAAVREGRTARAVIRPG